MQLLKAGILYFAAVFGAGFVLGLIRTLWVVPRLGARMAELLLRSTRHAGGHDHGGAMDSS